MAELTAGHINAVQRNVERLSAQLEQSTNLVIQRVGNVESMQSTMDIKLETLAATVEEFIRQDTLAKSLQLAETRLVKVRAEIESEFGHYGDVRHRTTGLLQALDTGVVSHETIQNTTENVMVATPRYWLAPALVGLAAWSRDDQELAQRALDEALRRDVAKTSLFFSLVLRRMKRESAATRWLSQFMARQDPEALGREFIVVLDAVASGAFGIPGRAVATEEIDRWLAEQQEHQEFLPRQIDRWSLALHALNGEALDGRYRHIEAHCQQWDLLAEQHVAAGMHANVISHFEAIFEGELRVPSELEVAMDDLLDRLVKDFDTEELPLRRQAAELQAVINHHGDTEAAKLDAQLAQDALDETVDFPSLLTNAAMNPKETGASRASERLAVALSRDWIVGAHDQITASYRDSFPSSLNLEVDGWTGTVEDGTDASDLGRSIDAFMDKKTAEEVDEVRFTGADWGIAGCGVAAIILTFVSPLFLLLGIGLLGWKAWEYKGLEKRRAQAQIDGDLRKKNANQTLQATMAEIVDFNEEWAAADSQAEEARGFLLSISPSENLAVSTHNTREVA